MCGSGHCMMHWLLALLQNRAGMGGRGVLVDSLGARVLTVSMGLQLQVAVVA